MSIAAREVRTGSSKMPANFASVGLIHLALPHARIVHAYRDPIDMCLSCFGLVFADEQPHIYELEELATLRNSAVITTATRS